MQIVYDLSRLATRVLNPTPNGIDWLDRVYADHFLTGDGGAWPLLFGPFGPRLFAPGLLRNPVETLERQWDGTVVIPDALVEALRAPIRSGQAAPRLSLAPPGRAQRIAGALREYALKRGVDPRSAAPRGAVYINVTHYPLESARHVAWLDARADVKPVFYIHDLLPILTPETFWRGEPERHARRLALLARRGAGAIVSSAATAEDLIAHMRSLGRPDLPIHTAPPPVAPLFRAPCPPDPRLSGVSYFVVCGTIEPRKNHALLAKVWRRLVADAGAATPKLVVVGKRGWRCEVIVAALSDPALGGAIVQVEGLPNGGWRALLAGARALLAPSLGEGYGLPLAEALASGTPAICSDIPPFREIAGTTVPYLDPRRPEEWLSRIAAFPERRLPAPVEISSRSESATVALPQPYFAALRDFLEKIPATRAAAKS